MVRYSFLLFCLCSVLLSGYSQNKKRIDTSSQNKGDTIKLPAQEFFILLDNDDVEFANEIPSHTFLKDSLVFALLDHPDAARMDSLWKSELINAGLYQGLRDSLLNLDYKEVVYDELSTDTLRARLKRLDEKTPLSIEYNPLLENVIKSYLKRNKKGMERLMALSAYYFPIFEQHLDKHNIPLEIKYLAIVESALNPRARSRVGATGLWQFMYYTGKMHGLEVNSYVDERMDPVRSTEAAARYLSTLYRVFEDWDLVLASYNSGPGNVSKAIRRSGSQDYWNLRPYLPRETAAYVPAFLATMYIFEYAEEHGFQPPEPKMTYFETDTVRVKELLTFDQITQLTGVEENLLQFLNPSYKLDVIPYVREKNYGIRLPRDQAGLFVNNEDDIYGYTAALRESKKEKLSPDALQYVVRKGDFLGRIAERFQVRVRDIKRWNNLKNNRLSIGQRLLIHASDNSTPAHENVPEVYTVRNGDSLWSISRKFPGLTIQEIKNLNRMDSNRLRPGMKLKLSQG